MAKLSRAKYNLRTNKKGNWFFFLVLGLLLIMNIGYQGFGKIIKNDILLASLPIQKFFWQQGQGINLFFESISQSQKLLTENQQLDLENQGLKARIGYLLGLKSENELLKKALGLKLEENFRLAMAQVIAKEPLKDEILITHGRDSAIAVGNAVITAEKVLVGKITEVLPNFARVALSSDTKSVFGAKIETENDEIAGIAKGAGNSKIVFDLIPQEATIQKGDLLTTTSLNNAFPKDLLIGQVIEVVASDVKPFQTARVNSSFKPENLEYIFVVTELK
jgi:rod shape-determining protein MreC